MNKIIIGVNDLKTTHPDILKYWNYKKNKNINPENISFGSGKKVWWICENGHEWESTVVNRVKGRNCPYCSNKKILKGYNDLFTTNPELKKEWDYEKNIDILPESISRGNGKKVWWICENGHSYDMSPNQKTYHKAGCPYCLNDRLLKGYNDFATTNPELASEWDYSKNKFNPEDVINANNEKVWWICKSGHSYSQTIISRKRGRGCPYCAYGTHTSFPEQAIHYYLIPFFSDLINNDRHLTVELDFYIPSLNIGIEYDGYYAHKSKINRDIKKNEICKNNNIKLIRIREDKLERLQDGDNIIYCKQNNIDSLESAIRELSYILNITPDINIKRDEIKIKELYDNFRKEKNIITIRPDLKSEWNYKRNYPIVPENVFANTSHKYWWICSKGHEWQQSPNKRVSGNRNCPYCANQKVLKGYNDLQSNYPELASEWHPQKNGNITPDSIIAKTSKKYWWLGKCGHEWDSAVSSRTKGVGCPYCANQKIKIGENDLSTTNPYLIDEWDYSKNSITPDSVTKSSKVKVWWICKKCNKSWLSSISTRTQGCGCPNCKQDKIVSSNRKALLKSRELLSDNKQLCLEYDYNKNKELPSYYTVSSGISVWWICKKGHSYQSIIANRTKHNVGCPYCCNKKVLLGYNDLASTQPNLIKEWDYEKNEILPTDITGGSCKKVWWKCPNCNNSWQAVIRERVNGYNKCNNCYNPRKGGTFKKAILQYDLNGNFIKKFESSADVERELKISRVSLCHNLKNKSKSAGGYIWKYEDKEKIEN